ncbi:MAG: HTH-type transcriptional activator Btr [Verrucomicrobiae bacterium]|nr:HTH-type transcriptional activator Btr [Verrucomicrobiae bacterium]
MSGLVNSMYFLANMGILFQSAVGTALGRVTLAGLNHSHAGLAPGEMRVYGSYALVYSLAGNAQYRDVRGHETAIHPGDLIIVFPDLGHWYGPPAGQTWDEFYVCFDGPVFDLWRKRGLLNPARPVYHLEPLDYWQHRLKEVIAPNLPQLERICRVQTALADALANHQRDVTAEQDESWLAQARTALDDHIERPLYVAAVARKLGLSHETFRKKFARLAGLSPYRYRQTRVIEHACRLVHEGRLTNKEIAARFGFSDEFHFSRRFKQVTGRSPAQFRALSRPHR